MIKGVQFVVDESGEKQAVLIDLNEHRELWEDFYDAALANSRRDDKMLSLEEAKRVMLGE
jgi:hypothetical protein